MALHDSIDIPYAWGPTGSCGYELATGIATVEPTSDLDLVVYADEPISREAARELSRMFTHPACRCDVQLDTPAGGIALREWARGDTRVLVKTPYGPVLSNQPWRVMSGA
jgi:phosphoribosyl-dephospho-CoA transferase